jgi:hypothetical protein
MSGVMASSARSRYRPMAMTTITMSEGRSRLAALFPPNVSVRKLTMPVEHGGWGILLEPIVLGLIVVPSFAGLLVALAAVAAFFARQPLKIALVDRSRGMTYPRTRTAFALAGLFALCGAAFFAGGVALAGWALALPAVLALPLALVQVGYDARNDSRRLLPELTGAIAMSGVVASIALAGGSTALAAAVLWGVMLGRAIPAILYIRARVLGERRGAASGPWPLAAHAAALGAGAFFYAGSLAPLVVPIAFAVLLARCAAGLSPLRRTLSARRVGFTEIGYGAATILAIAIAYAYA